MTFNDSIYINYVLPLTGLAITFIAQIYLKISYNKYKHQEVKSNKTGAETAREILDNNGLKHVKVTEVPGELTDHYDPRKKVISLSSNIYHGKTIASVSVAAHECGHAIQHKDKYFFLKIRNSIVPFVNISSKLGYLSVILGLIFGAPKLAVASIILLLAMLLFQIITLPVEFNASKRAGKLLANLNIITADERKDCKTMLTAAALTYVAGLMATLLQILRLALIVARKSRD